MSNTVLTTEDFILYLLKKVEPGKLDKIRLNKLEKQSSWTDTRLDP
ncbi:MAG: hypothetical protein UX60_C0014G0007 [Berkelbacteria bacterium GW2011_GWA2_46_7]|uniref:Uncharacterized protein n=1 Tax=Berkelbacteria bacterium GW2011_GWA2_46_7 TaxID=1618335 RepID=A0A0G1SPE9_9BACT|nr:MAG: hypothetical protein UX60_C0014G0007 [Berkelbacteria bacterium GW2011_GWA2_46_7]